MPAATESKGTIAMRDFLVPTASRAAILSAHRQPPEESEPFAGRLLIVRKTELSQPFVMGPEA